MGQLKYIQSINHFSHLHPLQLTNISDDPQNPKQLTCSGCTTQILPGIAYLCKPCNYILHASCIELPQLIRHPSDTQHDLTLIIVPSSAEGQFTCNACGSKGTGFSYHCGNCKVDLHTECASMALSLNHSSHPHPLTLLFSPPYMNKVFSCDICKNFGGNHWLYHCTICGFDVHLRCVHEANSSTSAGDHCEADVAQNDQKQPKSIWPIKIRRNKSLQDRPIEVGKPILDFRGITSDSVRQPPVMKKVTGNVGIVAGTLLKGIAAGASIGLGIGPIGMLSNAVSGANFGNMGGANGGGGCGVNQCTHGSGCRPCGYGSNGGCYGSVSYGVNQSAPSNSGVVYGVDQNVPSNGGVVYGVNQSMSSNGGAGFGVNPNVPVIGGVNGGVGNGVDQNMLSNGGVVYRVNQNMPSISNGGAGLGVNPNVHAIAGVNVGVGNGVGQHVPNNGGVGFGYNNNGHIIGGVGNGINQSVPSNGGAGFGVNHNVPVIGGVNGGVGYGVNQSVRCNSGVDFGVNHFVPTVGGVGYGVDNNGIGNLGGYGNNGGGNSNVGNGVNQSMHGTNYASNVGGSGNVGYGVNQSMHGIDLGYVSHGGNVAYGVNHNSVQGSTVDYGSNGGVVYGVNHRVQGGSSGYVSNGGGNEVVYGSNVGGGGNGYFAQEMTPVAMRMQPTNDVYSQGNPTATDLLLAQQQLNSTIDLANTMTQVGETLAYISLK